VILLALFVSLYIGDLEAWLVNVTAGEGIRRPPKVLEGATTLREKVWTRVIDPSTWTGVLYQVAQFGVGIGGVVVVVSGFSVAGSFIGAPAVLALADEAPFANDIGLDEPLEALALVPLGVLAWFATVHVVTLFSVLHAGWARLMLGSRARHLRAPPESLQPDPTPGIPAPAPTFGPGLPEVPLEPPLTPARPALQLMERVNGASAPVTAVAEPAETAGECAIAELTAREREVLLLVARGYSNADICEALYISEGTVKTHVRHILGKLGLQDRTQLIVFAYEEGIVTPSRRSPSAAFAR